jgi:hypothetical protein
MITQEFKDQMREFLISAFDVRSSVLYSPYSLADDMSFNEEWSMIIAPMLVGQELLSFFKEEGLHVNNIRCGLYVISLTL